MKRIAISLCVVVVVVTMVACSYNATSSENGDGNNSITNIDKNSPSQTSNMVSWHNLSVDTEGLSEREKIIVDYFDNNYFLVDDYFSLSKYANIYENANIVLGPLVIAKILSSDKETYEAIAIYSDIYDWGKQDFILEEDFDISIDGKNLVYLVGDQPSDGTLVAEREYLLVYGRYQGMIQKEVDGKTYNMAQISENIKDDAWKYEFGAPLSAGEYSREATAKAIFGNEIKLESCSSFAGGDWVDHVIITPNNQSNADLQAFILYEQGDFFPINKSLLEKDQSGNFDYNFTESAYLETKNKTSNISADFNHLILTTFNQSLKKVYIDYYNIETFNKAWSNEFDGVDVMAFDYTPDDLYLIIDDKLHIISLKDGTTVVEPILVGQIAYINVQPDGILLLKLGTGDNIVKLGLEGNTLWSLKVENIEIGEWSTYDGSYINYYIDLQNTGEHYVVQVNSLQRLAISFDGEVLVKEGDITPSQIYRSSSTPLTEQASTVAYALPSSPPVFNEVIASSVRSAMGSINYEARYVFDGDWNTAWCEGSSGIGIGEFIELRANTPQYVSGISILNGYYKSEKTYLQNNSIRTLRIVSDAGKESFLLSLNYNGGFQELRFSSPVETKSLRLIIDDVFRGSDNGGDDDDTLISEIKVF